MAAPEALRAGIIAMALVYELDTAINGAPEDLHRQWIDLVYRLGQDPIVLGTGGHLLYVGRKV